MKITRSQLLDKKVVDAVLNTISECDKSNKLLALVCNGLSCRKCPLDNVSPSCGDRLSTRDADGWRYYLDQVVFQIPDDDSFEEAISFFIRIMQEETENANTATMVRMTKLLESIYNYYKEEK